MSVMGRSRGFPTPAVLDVRYAPHSARNILAPRLVAMGQITDIGLHPLTRQCRTARAAT